MTGLQGTHHTWHSHQLDTEAVASVADGGSVAAVVVDGGDDAGGGGRR